MKILHIAENVSGGGGAESVFRDTITALKQNDLKNIHLVASRVNDNLLPFSLDLVFPNQKSKLHTALASVFSWTNYKLLYNFLKKERPNIIHIQNYGNLSPSVFKAIFLYKYKVSYANVKVVHTVHSFDYVCSHYAAYDYKKSKRCLDCANDSYKFKIFYRRCSRLGAFHSIGKGLASLIAAYYHKKKIVDKWITPSHFLRHSIAQSLLTEKENIKVVQNPLSDTFLNSKIVENKEDIIVCFGRISEEKNVALLINAYANYIQNGGTYKLIIIGNGPQMNYLKNLCKKLKIDKLITFKGFLEHDLLVLELKKAKIMVMPSQWFENAPMAIYEAVNYNVLPVVSGHGGMKELVEDLDCGLTFKSDDTKDLYLKIKEAEINRDFHLRNIQMAKDKMKTQNSYDIYAKKLIEIYDN